MASPPLPHRDAKTIRFTRQFGSVLGQYDEVRLWAGCNRIRTNCDRPIETVDLIVDPVEDRFVQDDAPSRCIYDDQTIPPVNVRIVADHRQQLAVNDQ
jgi:hypothetical protein